MKKILSVALVAASILGTAQISFAAKANVMVPTSSASWKNMKTAMSSTIESKGKNITGFNAGLSMKVDLNSSIYVMPEIYYSNFNNEVSVEVEDTNQQTTLKAKSSRIDVPVLLGYNLLGNLLSAHLGPVASFNLAKDSKFDHFVESVNAKEFTVGYQIGLQSEIKKIIITARYEGALSEDQRRYVTVLADSNQQIAYDNRNSLFLFGLGYKF